MQRNGVGSLFEIVFRVQIGNNPWLNRSPSQLFLRQRAGSRAVDAKEASDPAKMIGCFLGRFADDRYVQATADCLSDLSSGYALVGDAVIRGSSTAFLKYEPIEMSSIEPVHRRPAIETVPYKCGNALLTCDPDQVWHKAVITVAMDRRRKPQHRGPDSACRQRERLLLRLAGEVGIVCILFRCERALALSEQGSGRDDQRAIRSRERAAESLDGTPIRLGGGPIV